MYGTVVVLLTGLFAVTDYELSMFFLGRATKKSIKCGENESMTRVKRKN